MQSFFTSDKCPDFAAHEAPIHQVSRPFSANSQCGKILTALLAGRVVTTLSAIEITGGTEGGRRLREVRTYLASIGTKLQWAWFTTANGARVKAFWINNKDNHHD